jgi:hypothetical protein
MPRNTTLYGQAGTITFRRNSSGITCDFINKIKRGTNLQNIEKEMRALYWADEGKILVQRDQSGAEALIVAYLTKHGKFRDLFLNKVKPHVFVALHLFASIWQRKINEYAGDIKLDIRELIECPIPDLQKHPFWKAVDRLIKSSDNWSAQERYYYIAKQICHSSNYGIRADAFRMNTLEKSRGKIVLSKKQAEDYLSFYHALFSEIREWHRDVEAQLEATKTLYNLFGFPREFTGVLNDSTIKEALAFIPQSTVGCITGKAVVDTQKYIEENNKDWDILADTHDSFLVQCPVGDEQECSSIMKQHLNQTLKSPNGETFTMKSEGQAGFNWAPTKYDNDGKIIKNEYGLKELKD